jgi:hexosaminidase
MGAMNRRSCLACFGALLTGAAAVVSGSDWESPHTPEQLASAPAALIPFPCEATWGGGVWSAPRRVIVGASDEASNAYRSLAELLQQRGVAVERGKPGSGGIRFAVDTNVMGNAEGYVLEVSATGGVAVVCGGPAGAFYAVQTLRQMLSTNAAAPGWPVCRIRDWPAFGLRGFMHDTGRNFQDIESLKAQIDRLAAYKFNTFHWHLTDNPAWRPESKVYPQLNDPKYRKEGRDPGRTYSFDEIRTLIRFAAERHVRIIPELDMPGHSEYFERTFGFRMGTEKGMAVLEKLIDEFCAGIPAGDCPIVHLGSDEVHIPDPLAFMRRMQDRVRANGRSAMVWNPGLAGDGDTIEQLWRDDDSVEKRAADSRRFVDSACGYLNSGDALGLVQRYFFHQPCRRASGDSRALGGILCCWPDVRVDDKRKIFLHSPVWPGALAYAEAVWNGRAVHGAGYLGLTPQAATPAWRALREFESRLAAHRDRYFSGEPFPYVQFGHVPWRVVGPFTRGTNDPPDLAFAPEREIRDEYPEAGRWKAWTERTGGWLNFRAIVGGKGPYDRMTMYALTYLHSATSGTARAWLGFETPGRATRRCGGIPPSGEWCAHGGALFLNDRKVPGPAWKQPGANRFLAHTWGSPANEIPYSDEEFYWARDPAEIPLQAGWNKILLRVPCGYADQNWSVTFVPVREGEGGRWVEDLTVPLAACPAVDK